MKLKAITLASLLFLTQFGYGQQIFEKVGTSGAHFLDISMDAGIKGMGDAYTALVLDNAGAIHYNPATLVYIPSWSAHFGNVGWFAGIGLNSVAAAYNLGGAGAVGVYYRGLNSGDIDETTPTQQLGTGNVYNWQDMLLGVTFARSFTDRFSAGVNLGYLNESISEYDLSASAWVMDLGTFYMTGFQSLRLGMTIRNFGPEIDFEQTFIDYNNGEEVLTPEKYRPFPMPLTFQVGLAYDFLENTDNQLLTVSVDAVHPNDSAERLHLGFDYRFLNTIHVRGGGYSNHNSASLMGGIGLDLQKIGVNGRFDYSVANYGLIGFVHQFSMIISG